MKKINIIEEGRFERISNKESETIKGGALCVCDARFQLGDPN